MKILQNIYGMIGEKRRQTNNNYMEKTKGYEEFVKAVAVLDKDEPYDTHQPKFDYRDMKCAFNEGKKDCLWVCIIVLACFVFFLLVISVK